MTPELAAFSDWVLAILPRLFLYPGGLWMLAGMAVIKVASGGKTALQPRQWAADLSQVNLVGAATAWAALALLPLPGAAKLPSPVDQWVLVALLAVSFLVELEAVEGQARQWILIAGAGITLALLVPLAHSQGLLAANEASPNIRWGGQLAIFSVGLGIAALIWAGEKGIGSQVRGLAWVGLALTPLWAYLPDNWLTPTMSVFLLAGLVWGGSMRVAGEIPAPNGLIRLALVSQWLLALVALLLLLFLG
jgi:hypothetical protein